MSTARVSTALTTAAAWPRSPHLSVAESPLEVTVTQPRPSLAIVGVVGELDVATASRLHAVLERRLVGVGGTVVVDLSQVCFLAIAGVNALIDVQRRAQAERWNLRLVTEPRCVRRLLALTGLQTSFDCHSSLHRALLAYRTDRLAESTG